MIALVDIDDQLIANALSAGIDGGINHWFDRAEPKLLAYDKPETLKIDMTPVTFFADDGDTKGELTYASLQAALNKMAKVAGGRHMTDLLEDNADAETGDVLIQLACFGDIVFG